MRQVWATMILAAALAACGGGSGGPTQASNDVTQGACAAVTEPDALFGAGATAVASSDLPSASGACSFSSADGMRLADVILYDANSLGATTPEAQMTSLTAGWSESGVTPQDVEGVGDSAQLAVGLPGAQSQIVLRKGASVANIVATSGDEAVTSEDLVRQIADQVAATL